MAFLFVVAAACAALFALASILEACGLLDDPCSCEACRAARLREAPMP